MFKTTKVEKNIKEINILINLQINLSSCRTSDYFLSLSLMRTHQELKVYCTKFLKGKQIMVAEKMWQKSHCVYPLEIIQINLLGRLQKNSLEHNDCLYAASVSEWSVRKPPTDDAPSLQNYFRINCQSVIPMLLKSIEATLEQSV